VVRDRWVFGVEARDGMFFCTAMAGDGTVRAMRVFPPGARGVMQFVRFAARQGPSLQPPVIGLLDRTSGPVGGRDLAEAFRREGFQVCPVNGERVAGSNTAVGRALDGGRNSRRAARAVLQPGRPGGGGDE
jgi:hypothetical protein